MGNVDGLKVQVEELKQRLCASDAQQPTETGEFKDRLASIKATLQAKQNEIDRLAAENKQLQSKQDESERLATENKQLQSKQDESERLATENKQLRGMLNEVLSAFDEHQTKTSGDMLRAFYAETAGFVEPGKAAAAKVGEVPQSKAGPASIIQPKQAADPHQGQPATPAAQDEDGADFEDSPALRRIMKRGRKGR